MVYSNSFFSENGYASIVFNTDKVKLKGIATSGWDGLGKFNTINKCVGNVIYEINGEPALDEIKKIFWR